MIESIQIDIIEPAAGLK